MKQATRVGLMLLALLAPRLVAAQGTIIPSPYQTVLDASGNPVSQAKVCTYLAGTTTPVFTFTSSTMGVNNTNPIVTSAEGRWTAWLNPTLSYRIVEYSNDGTANTCDGTLIKDVDGVQGVPNTSGTTDITGTAGEAIALGKAAYVTDGSGGTAGRWYTASSALSTSALKVPVGIVVSASTGAGSSVTVRTTGLAGNVSGLTPGGLYYLSTAGGLATVSGAFTRVIGVAQSATTIILGTPGPEFATTRVLTNAISTTAIVNTVTPTQVFTYSVPGGSLNTYRALRLTGVGIYGNTAATTKTLTVDLSYGGQGIISGAGISIATGSTPGPFYLDCLITAIAATNAQNGTCSLRFIQSGIPAAPRKLDTYGYQNAAMTVDSTSAQNIIIQVTHSAADPLTTVTMSSVVVELVGQ